MQKERQEKEINTGDTVVTKAPFWHKGEDLGDRLGRVVSTESYILVDIFEYHDNPVKCFKTEVELVEKQKEENLWDEDTVEIDLNDLFGGLMTP